MRTAWLLIPILSLAGCDSVVTASGTDGETSTTSGPAGSTTTPTDTTPTLTTTGIGSSSTTDNPLTAGNESSSTGDASSSSSGETSSSSSTGFVGSSSGGSSESSSSTTDTTDTAETTGVSFIDPSDSGPGTDECDPYLQDCPAGDKCNAWSNDGGGNWNALGCFPIDPAMDQPGDPCTVEGGGTSGVDSCALGSMCWDVDEDTDIGVCISMCEGSADMPTCPDPSTSCTIANDGVLNLCLPGCDPLMQDCPVGQACYPVDDAFVCAPDASGEDAGMPGDPCAFINACDPGNACITPDAVGPGCFGGGCCSQFCNLTAPVCTLPGHECLPWFDDGAAPPQYVDVGICSVPA